MSSPFPLAPAHSLTRDDVVNFLVRCKDDGHPVFRGGGENAFNLHLDDDRILLLLESPGGPWLVTHEKLGVREVVAKAGTLPQFEKAIAQAAARSGKQWPCRPNTGRLFADTPATNFRTISQLVDSSCVEAVFDPYLENCSLTTLINILSFGSSGGGVANGVRLLGSEAKTKGRNPTFTKTGVDAWLTQLRVTGEARVVPPNDQHRRFMLLSGGRSLIIGHSLNAIHKNEAVSLDVDAVDRAFFDGVWASAMPLT